MTGKAVNASPKDNTEIRSKSTAPSGGGAKPRRPGSWSTRATRLFEVIARLQTLLQKGIVRADRPGSLLAVTGSLAPCYGQRIP